MQKPSTPSGTRDFSPAQVSKRDYLFETIKTVFKKYGYLPIETPAMENLSTLSGKYGEEGDQLLFRILNSGDYLKKVTELSDYKHFTTQISEKGLRYDLTVPFARYVVTHQNELTFPFRRYQIQPVWRADRPQKGRYREFYQCDADVVGADSLLNEAELLEMADEIYAKLGLKVVVKINSRKVLQGLAQKVGQPDKMVDITVAIDKLDKIGWEGVEKELAKREITPEGIAQIQNFIEHAQDLPFLQDFFAGIDVAAQGLAEVETVFTALKEIELTNKIEFDATLARGLGYYTGCIFEVKSLEAQMGSIGGGGRYDDLTGIFGMKGYSGVGISFGVERIYDIMEELQLFPAEAIESTQIMVLGFDEKARLFAIPLLRKLREAGIRAELYTENKKIQKQLDYVNKRQIRYALLIGENEMQNQVYTLKDMQASEQHTLDVAQIIAKLTAN
ncbi:histidine--tRNA ligase [Hugenholtzia roseola]|uniref:histidine--tRNA ligase n=1 Tax=Hugenholtzia roseola TaxID=1002 RepID=UPI00047A100A|nr:histidine--tRNA ligase [Hugenholtzia roseola]